MAVGALVQSFRFGGVGLGLADPRTELDRTLDQLVDFGGVEPTERVQQAVGADQVPKDLVLLFVGCSTSHHRECGFVQPCQCGFEQRPLAHNARPALTAWTRSRATRVPPARRRVPRARLPLKEEVRPLGSCAPVGLRRAMSRLDGGVHLRGTPALDDCDHLARRGVFDREAVGFVVRTTNGRSSARVPLS